MFVGLLKVGGYSYNVTGTDSSNACSLRLVARDEESQAYMLAEEFREDDFMCDLLKKQERRVDVGISRVKVEAVQLEMSDGRKLKAKYNPELFCRLGALIQYCKKHCSNTNRVDYTGLTAQGETMELGSTYTYSIKYPTHTDDSFAEVTLCYGNIKHLCIDLPDFYFKVESYENDGSTEMFFPLKNAWASAFMQTEEYLGFDLPKVTFTPMAVSVADGLYHTLEEVMKAHPEKEFDWLRTMDYKLVTDDTLEATCNYILKYQEPTVEETYVYYDTETTGLNINFKSRTGEADQLVGVVLSVKDGESFFFPTKMKKIPNLCGGDDAYFMEHYMRPILEGRKLVTHNGPFDWKVAHIYGINANIVHDTLQLLAVTKGREDMNWTMIGLKSGTRILLHRDSLELSDLTVNDNWGENSDFDFSDLTGELVQYYACADTDNTRGIFKYCIANDLLGKYGASKVYEIEIAFSKAVAYQEFYGHRMDIANIEHVKKETDATMEELRKKIFAIAGHEFNINSPQQLLRVLYNEQGIPEQISRKTNRPTTDAETLKKLAEITNEDDEPMYPIVQLLVDFRKFEGVRKIIDKLPEYMTKDGYIFSEVQQFGTATGRISVKEPNYQSYSDTVKKNVVPRPGYYMFDTDYSSVEYRVLASMVGNEKIKTNFADPDFDYHTYQAAHMYNVPYASVTKKLRKAAKGINFGLPYGMGDESLGARIFGEASAENTMKAMKLRAAYFKGQEDIRDWFEYHRNRGINEGYNETYFGRRRYYDKHREKAGAIKRQAGNFVIQGTAADIYKLAVGRVFNRICREGWLGKVLIVGFIHDEVLGEVSNDINPAQWLKVLREEFEVKIVNQDGTPWCPLYMGFGYGTSWYEAKSVELPIKLQWEIVEKYGETGFPEWDGDARKFCDTIPDKLRDFEIRDIAKQITAPESQGKEIKPALNSALLDVVKEDSNDYTKGIREFFTKNGADFDEKVALGKELFSEYVKAFEGMLCEDLDKNYHIQSLVHDEDGNILSEFKPSKETQEALTQFCMLHNIDRTTVDLQNIPDVELSGNSFDSGSADFMQSTTAPEFKARVLLNLGVHLDTTAKSIYLLMTGSLPKAYLDELKAHIAKIEETDENGKPKFNGYQLKFLKYWEENGMQRYQTQLTSYFVPYNEREYIQNLWHKVRPYLGEVKLNAGDISLQ